MHPIRFLLRHLWAATALTVVVIALITFAVRMLLPLAGHFRPEVERIVSSYAERPVTIEALEMEWLGREPMLYLRGVSLHAGEQADGPKLRLSHLHLSLDLWSLLTEGELKVGRLVLSGVEFSLARGRDGVPRLEGFTLPGGESAATDPGVASWLISQPRLALLSSTVTLRDEASGRDYRFDDVNLEFANGDGERRLSGALRLPAELGERLSFILRFQGELTAPSRWNGTLYAKGRALRPAGLPAGLLPAKWKPIRGEVDAEVWSRWRDGRLEGLTTDVELRDAVIGETALDALGGLAVWRRDEAGWRLDVERLHLRRGERQWRDLGGALRRDHDGSLEAAVERLDLTLLTELALESRLLDEARHEPLAALRPRGTLRDAAFRYAADGDWRVRGRLEGWGNDAWGALPAVEGLGGHVEGDRRGGRVALGENALRLTLPKLFRDPLELDRIAGALAWSEEEEGWRIHSPGVAAENADLTTLTRLDLRLPRDGGAPFLDLQTDYRDGDGSHTSRYLPAHIMPKNAVAWLDRAIVGARVTGGGALFHGPLDKFPFDGGEGRFEVRFNIVDGLLDYQQGWPRMEEIEAEIAFVNRGLRADGIGVILGGDIRRVEVEIPDLTAPTLTIDGEALAPASDLLAILRDTPLSERVGGYFRGMAGTGHHQLDLTITLPLSRPELEIATRGRVRFRGGSLDLGVRGLLLEQVEGDVRFDNDGMSAEGVRAQLLGRPITIDAAPHGREGITRLTAAGRLPIGPLLKPYAPFPASHLSGDSDWRLRLDLPGRTAAARGKQVAARLESELRGVAVGLPEPLSKPADEPLPFEMEMNFSHEGGADSVTFRAGDWFSGTLATDGKRDGAPRALALRLGPGKLPTPPEHGIHLDGTVQWLALAPWLELWEALQGHEGDLPTLEFTAFNLHAEALELYNHFLPVQGIAGERRDDGWYLTLDGPDAKGWLRLPPRWTSDHTLEADFQRLKLTPLAGGEEGAELPVRDLRDWPALHLRADSLAGHGLELGEAQVMTRPVDDGQEITRLRIHTPALTVETEGAWHWNRGNPFTQVQLSMDSDDLGGALTALGYSDTIAAGSGVASAHLKWPGDPAAFGPTVLDGRLWLKLSKGRVLEVNPGAGRAFGLLSLQALPRRLTLDFSDLFGKGLSFDTIEGSFTFSDGDAYTNTLFLESPAARIDVTGRTGLKARDYDQMVTVTPRISSSLPIAGTLAGGPAVGAVLLIADRLFRSELDKITRTHYAISGSWDDPEVVRVKRNEPIEEEPHTGPPSKQ